jgi:hypothetical protein
MIQFLDSFRKLTSIHIEIFNVTLNQNDFREGDYGHRIFDNFQNINLYESCFNQIAPSIEFPIALERTNKQLPHYRLFEFRSDEVNFNLRIDGGIAHGFRYDFNNPKILPSRNEVFNIYKYVDYDIIYNVRILS